MNVLLAGPATLPYTFGLIVSLRKPERVAWSQLHRTRVKIIHNRTQKNDSRSWTNVWGVSLDSTRAAAMNCQVPWRKHMSGVGYTASCNQLTVRVYWCAVSGFSSVTILERSQSISRPSLIPESFGPNSSELTIKILPGLMSRCSMRLSQAAL